MDSDHDITLSQPSNRYMACPNCVFLEQQLAQQLNWVARLKEEERKYHLLMDQLRAELKALSDQYHQKQLDNGNLQKQNIELRREILRMEQEFLQRRSSDVLQEE